ncbi:hypothetical protein ACOSP7_003718 [Xanthoceras sorbifolium]
MSAKLRCVRTSLKVHYSFPSLSSSKSLNTSNSSHTPTLSDLFTHFNKKTLNNPLSSCNYCSSSSSSSSNSFDYLNQFLPFCNHTTNSSTFVNSNERRRIVVGLSKIVKTQQGFLELGVFCCIK